MSALTAVYPGLLRASLAHPFLVLAIVGVVLAGSAVLVPGLGVDLIPPFAQGEFSFKVTLPEGTPLEVTDRTVASLAQVLEGWSDAGSSWRRELEAELPGATGFSPETVREGLRLGQALGGAGVLGGIWLVLRSQGGGETGVET